MKLKLERGDDKQLVSSKRAPVVLPRSVYYTRFPSFFEKNTDLPFNTYHRSAAKKLDGVKSTQFTFMGNQAVQKLGMFPKIGNFYNPFAFDSYKKAVTSQRKDASETQSALWYDKLLNYQKNAAKFVVKTIKTSNRMQINSDHGYPCVLVALDQPLPAEKNIKIWTNFMSIYLIAICNQLAAEKGLNIELVRRSSFDAVRPSVAECGKSLRISLGMSPKAYHQCIVEALQYLDKLFENNQVFNVPVDPSGKVKNMLDKYNEKKSSNVELKDNLWDSLWANGDSLNRSFATQIFRREHVVNVIIDNIQENFGEHSVQTLFASVELMRACFAQPMVEFFASLHCQENKLSTSYATKELSKFNWQIATPLNDKGFWALIKAYGKALGAPETEIKDLCGSKNPAELYHYLECWLANFTFNPRKYDDVQDGYGSDSDAEDRLEVKEEVRTIASKKFITATGMRAIQLSFAAAKKFLEEKFKTDPAYIEFNADKMYYETYEAISAHAIEYPVKESSDNLGPQKKLNFFDLNHCNTQQLSEKRNLVEVAKRDRICILDTTSSTIDEIAKNIIRIWKLAPKLRVILTISSGLKNEQGMADYNPYGTIRIFASSRDDCDFIYKQLVEFENQAQYLHPKTSHELRKNAKDEGFTPTNEAIINACKGLNA